LYGHYPGFNFRNNIFIYHGSFLDEGQQLENEIFQGNVYWNLSGGFTINGYKSIEEWAKATGNEMVDGSVKGLFKDPLLAAPGTATVTDPSKLLVENLSAYSVKPGSPLIDNGLNLKDMFGIEPGERDIFGTKIPQGQGFEIGAVEYSVK
jgi:hypothetical protein